jgi:hypothetical protein
VCQPRSRHQSGAYDQATSEKREDDCAELSHDTR